MSREPVSIFQRLMQFLIFATAFTLGAFVFWILYCVWWVYGWVA